MEQTLKFNSLCLPVFMVLLKLRICLLQNRCSYNYNHFWIKSELGALPTSSLNSAMSQGNRKLWEVKLTESQSFQEVSWDLTSVLPGTKALVLFSVNASHSKGWYKEKTSRESQCFSGSGCGFWSSRCFDTNCSSFFEN